MIRKLNNCIGIRQKEISQKVYARPAYLISHKTECKVYQETKCGVKTCCFECIRRFVCKEFDGGCDRYTRETYKSCSKLIQEQKTDDNYSYF